MTPETQKNYDFIDNMRFMAMIGIVMEHSSPFLSIKRSTFHDQLIQTLSLQIPKFGTIVFFILAGFLIGDKLHQYSTKQYLSRRLHTTFRPWLFWVSIFMLLLYINEAVLYFKHYQTTGFSDPLAFIAEKFRFIVVDTSFWFIINFLLCITILLSFRKYLYRPLFGIILGLLSLFYSVNLYYEWIPTLHTMALLGFVFYLWLGVILHRYFERFERWVQGQSFIFLSSLVLLSYILGCVESLNLMHLGSQDALNTLRVSNILYSFACFLFLYRYCNFKAIEKLKPRSMTFGIHLVHHILVIIFLPMLTRPLKINYNTEPAWNLFFLQFITFPLIYGTTYVIVYYLGKSKKYSWIVGQ